LPSQTATLPIEPDVSMPTTFITNEYIFNDPFIQGIMFVLLGYISLCR